MIKRIVDISEQAYLHTDKKQLKVCPQSTTLSHTVVTVQLV